MSHVQYESGYVVCVRSLFHFWWVDGTYNLKTTHFSLRYRHARPLVTNGVLMYDKVSPCPIVTCPFSCFCHLQWLKFLAGPTYWLQMRWNCWRPHLPGTQPWHFPGPATSSNHGTFKDQDHPHDPTMALFRTTHIIQLWHFSGPLFRTTHIGYRPMSSLFSVC